ncbi:hypothetical protein [Helicobacter pullorum]|nr:hypothetical protein [Helicobacter pullorum]
MIFDVKFKKSIEKEIKKLEKSNPKVADKIIYFIFSNLASSQKP